jgi:FKBP-type peptidyl-prolyl cis-trans isomerase
MKYAMTLMMILALPAFAAKSEGKTEAKKEKAAKAEVKKTTTKDGLVIEDVKVGTGKEAKLGATIKVAYKGTLAENGKEFDSSTGIEFPLMEGRLIKGWTDGIPGMKVGGKRKLHIPAKLAYGERGTPGGPIGKNKDLDFEVELLDVK